MSTRIVTADYNDLEDAGCVVASMGPNLREVRFPCGRNFLSDNRYLLFLISSGQPQDPDHWVEQWLATNSIPHLVYAL